MKIAIVYDMLYPFNVGGAEIRNYQMAKSLARRHEVHLFGVKMWDGPDVIQRENIYYHGVCRYSAMYDFAGARTVWEPIKFALKLFLPLLKEKFDIIDTSSFVYFHCFTCKAVSILRRTPLVFTWHQYWGDYWYDYVGGYRAWVGKLIEKIVKHLTEHHIAVSFTTKKDLLSSGLKSQAVSVIYNGIDPDLIKDASPLPLNFDVLFVGRLIHQKNVECLIEAAGLIKETNPNIRVGIVGCGPNYEKLKKMARERELEKNIFFTGFLSHLTEVYSYMKSAKVFVLPSLLEGFGIVVIEANACGLPVIVVRNGWNAATELITDGQNGFTINNNDAKDLSQKIIDLLADENLRLLMSDNAKKFATNFDWQDLGEKLEKYYLNLKK